MTGHSHLSAALAPTSSFLSNEDMLETRMVCRTPQPGQTPPGSQTLSPVGCDPATSPTLRDGLQLVSGRTKDSVLVGKGSLERWKMTVAV